MIRRAACVLTALAFPILAAPAAAQNWPTKPVRVVVTVPPGGAADVAARLAAPKMGAALGQPVVIENSAGQFGTIAAFKIARAEPDGYSLLFTTPSSMILAHFTLKKVPYTPNDHTPITAAVETVTTLVVHPSVPANNAKEFVAYLKQNPNKLFYGAGAAGSVFHLMMEAFMDTTGTRMRHVAYKGVIDAVNATVAGQTQVTMSALSNVRPHLGQGLRILGILEAERFEPLKDVPTLGEQIPGYEKPQSWFGLFGPAKMDPAVVQRLYREMAAALKAPDVRPKLENVGMAIVANTPEEFATLIKRGHETYGAVFRKAGLQPR